MERFICNSLMSPVLGKTMATNNNNGINVPFGSSYPMIIGPEVYVFPSYHLTMDKNELIKYRRTNGILQEREACNCLPITVPTILSNYLPQKPIYQRGTRTDLHI